jgi:hypothetical protein
MTHVDTPQSRCRVGIACADITPPIGIYHRMWGAAVHDRAAAIHRPLIATALWLEPEAGSDRRLILALDHCILDREEIELIRQATSQSASLNATQTLVTLSHTHGSGWMSRTRSHWPGGELIGPYLDRLAEICGEVARTASQNCRPATIVYGTARCALAAHRDFWDETNGQFVCGYNPTGPADDTVLVARIMADSGELLATVVNYACHPTTLAWENTAISPDYIGALRETVERHTKAPCLFLQGASGDLGPREGYVGDPSIADRNGRQLAFAALSGLEALPPPGTRFVYAGPVVSGAVLGTWKHEPLGENESARLAVWDATELRVELPYRIDLPTIQETQREQAHWQAEEDAARQLGDEARLRECRAKVEQMTRRLARLIAMPDGKAYPLPVSLLRLGDSVWVFTAGELYQSFQTALRARFPEWAIVVTTLTGDWHPGYLPTAATYGAGIYQEQIAAIGPGGLEVLTESVARAIRRLVERSGSPAGKSFS